jgi:hypothetical protein
VVLAIFLFRVLEVPVSLYLLAHEGDRNSSGSCGRLL